MIQKEIDVHTWMRGICENYINSLAMDWFKWDCSLLSAICGKNSLRFSLWYSFKRIFNGMTGFVLLICAKWVRFPSEFFFKKFNLALGLKLETEKPPLK